MDSKLLEWAIKNQDTEAPKQSTEELREKISSLDPEIIQMIFGRDEAVVMRECAQRIASTTGAEQKLALEDLEMIVENLDSAVNMGKMNLWPVVLKVVSTGSENSPVALGLIATAAQNNEQVQAVLVGLDVLQLLIDKLADGDELTVVKTLGAISSLLQNLEDICLKFEDLKGFEAIRDASKKFPQRTEARIDHLRTTLALQFPHLQLQF